MPHPALSLLLVAALQAGRIRGHPDYDFKEYIVNEAVDSPTPGDSCDEGCNLRTAWALASQGDNISIEVDPVMDGPMLQSFRDKLGYHPIIMRGNLTGGGRATITAKDQGYEFLKYTDEDFGSLSVVNLAFQGFNGTSVFNILPSQKPFVDGHFLFDNTVFIRNVVTAGLISMWEGSNLTITNSQFHNNRAEGLSLIFCFKNPACTIQRSEFSGNVVVRGELISTGKFGNVITECRFVDNEADVMFSSQTYTNLYNSYLSGLTGGLTGGKYGTGGRNVTAIWAVKTGGYIATGVRDYGGYIGFRNSTFRTAHPEGSIALASSGQVAKLVFDNVDPGLDTSQLTPTPTTSLGDCKDIGPEACFRSQCKPAFNRQGQRVGTKCVKTGEERP